MAMDYMMQHSFLHAQNLGLAPSTQFMTNSSKTFEKNYNYTQIALLQITLRKIELRQNFLCIYIFGC